MERPEDIAVDELWDKYLRALAEKENMIKQHRTEVLRAEERGAEEIIKKLLPIIDNLERGYNQAMGLSPESGRGALKRTQTALEQIRDGMALVTRQAHQTLSTIGVNPFDCQYQPFDPEKMDAISKQPSTEVKPGHVIGEIERGYTREDRILRPAKVAVAVALEGGSDV